MFYQVRVPTEHRKFLRFFWWPDGNIDADLKEYEMCVHSFGAVLSPSCANYALKKTANDHEHTFGKVAADTVRNDFYVDDMLKSVPTPEMAKEVLHDVIELTNAGGFPLGKVISNSKEVLQSLPEVKKAKSVKNLDLTKDVLPVERALGVIWCAENDCFSFRTELKDTPLTRRGILSTVSSIYDPLGLATPFLLTGRRILQKLCVNCKG